LSAISFLAFHSVDRNRGSFDLEQFELARNCSNLVRLLFGLNLAQDNAMFGCSGAVHVNENFVLCVTKRASQSLAVNCDNFSSRHLCKIGVPFSKRFLQAMGIESGKNTPDGVLRGDSVGEFEKLLQESLLALTEQLDINKRLRTANDSQQG
jgi:hypothetical protein